MKNYLLLLLSFLFLFGFVPLALALYPDVSEEEKKGGEESMRIAEQQADEAWEKRFP